MEIENMELLMDFNIFNWFVSSYFCRFSVDSYESHESVLYCKPHFKLLFSPKVVEDSEPGKFYTSRRQLGWYVTSPFHFSRTSSQTWIDNTWESACWIATGCGAIIGQIRFGIGRIASIEREITVSGVWAAMLAATGYPGIVARTTSGQTKCYHFI